MKKDVLSQVASYTQMVVKELGLDLVDVQLVKESGFSYLRIFIENLEGELTTEDCAKVNEKISTFLDEADPIKEQYFLEVSSPGLDRPLKKPEDFSRFKGHLVQVKTYKKIGGKKVFVGTLEGLFDDEIHIYDEDKEEKFVLDFNEVANVKLTIKF
ncbi:ribosome maturation factor RimP [Proteinivorax hydrogeniformans]|uniref:Ribosome maturation factor RimP n=1 Tax=Proteinivorax hydrogeniformans TaxID=1826727 RepID=A0AAU8HQL2_9FIRM